MLVNIIVGVLIMMLCLLVQAVLLLPAAQYYRRHLSWIDSHSVFASTAVIGVVMVFLVVGNLVQGAIWAAIFLMLGEFSDFQTAYYHSLVNFATLGYGDMVMSERWRLLGPLQAINGVIMIGFSTAALGAAAQDSLSRGGRGKS